MEHVNLIENDIAHTLQTAGGTEMVQQYLLHLIWLDVRIADYLAVGSCHVYHGHLIARPDTGDGFDAHIDTQLQARLPHSGIHLCRPAGLAAVFHTQTHLALRWEPGVET